MRTQIDLPLSDRLSLLSQAGLFRARYLVGKLAMCIAPNTRSPRLQADIRRAQRYDEIMRTSDYDKLPPEILNHLLEVQVDQVDSKAKWRAETFGLTDENISTEQSKYGTGDYALTAREAMALLNEDASLDVVVHVGARVDVVSSYLAPKYPDRTFISVDLQQNLAEHNKYLPSSPNWKVQPGYIIDLLERKVVAPKLMVLAFTSCKMTEREFENMIRLAPTVKTYLLIPSFLADPSRFSLTLPKPEDLSHSYANCMRVMDPDLPNHGYGHNYHAILERNGFQVTKSLIRRADNTIKLGGALVIVAKRMVGR